MAIPFAENSSENPFSNAAQLYRDAGWLGAIPIPYGEKYPPPRGYTGNKAPYPDDKQVAKWIDSGPFNIALRLSEVPGFIPVGHLPCGYELIGIDVDEYEHKNGAEQLRLLEEKLGHLPATVRSSSRWHISEKSCIYVFLVPAGYRFLGKADRCIEIIQKGHRYMMTWPSINPDADNSPYRFRAPNGAYYDEGDQGSAIPPLEDVAVLPEAWMKFLTCNHMEATDDPISDLSGDELLEWASKCFNDSDGEMCRVISSVVDKKISEISESSGSHPILTSAHWTILRFAAEGHSGWIAGLKKFNNAWAKSALSKRDRDTIVEEVQRSVIGALSKIEPEHGIYTPDDTCAEGNVTALHDVENFHAQIENDAPDDFDPGDLGPIIGRVQRDESNPPGGYDQNDHGNARHFIDLFGNDVKYISTRQSWILWDGERWRRDMDEKLASRAFSVVEQRQKQFANKITRDSTANIKRAESWRKWALRSGNVQQVKNALTMAKSLYIGDQPIAIDGSEFDAKPNLLGCENGILVLDSEPVLRKATKEDYVTYNTNVPYIPWDTHMAHESGLLEGYKLWQEYLDMFLPNEELRHFIQKVMGHLLIGENPEKLLIFAYGPRDTGKSTMLTGIRSALGDYYGTIDIKLFKHVDLNPGLIRAVPLRVTGMSEIEAGRMDANMIKRLTGNDMVVAEAKFSNDIFEGRPQFTTIIACNREPNILDVDEALQERILVLPFEYQISNAKKRYDRQVDIEKYAGTAVLSWMVEGWKSYCQEGLKRDDWPIDVKRLSGDVAGHLNAVQMFIDECIEKNSTEKFAARERAIEVARKKHRLNPAVADWEPEWTPSTDSIYELYTRWCVTNGEVQQSLHQLTKELGVGNPQTRSVKGYSRRCYVGIRIKNQEEE